MLAYKILFKSNITEYSMFAMKNSGKVVFKSHY